MSKFTTVKKWLSSNWIITITGTMIGVFAAFFLNDWREESKAMTLRNRALDKIVEEVESNEAIITKNFEELSDFLEAFNKISQYEGDIVMRADEMLDFQSNYPGLLKVIDSSALGNGVYRYHKVMMDIDIPSINQLSDFAWTTLKSTNIQINLSFECLLWLETTYGLQMKLQDSYDEIFQILAGNVEGELSKKVELILAYESILIRRYEKSEENIGNCKTTSP